MTLISKKKVAAGGSASISTQEDGLYGPNDPLFRSNMTGDTPSNAPGEDMRRRLKAINQIGTYYEEKGGAQSEDPYVDPGAEANAAKDYTDLRRATDSTEKRIPRRGAKAGGSASISPRWKSHMKRRP